MKYLKYFETEAAYASYKNGSDFITPNVSYVVETKGVSYEPESSYIAVDLGLPSGRLWADRNVGAESPEDYGLYFQWGDTVGYTRDQIGIDKDKVFDWNTYFDTTDGGNTFNKYTPDKLTRLEASDDAATVNMGSDWRMPTEAEMQELIDNTTSTFIDLQGNEFSPSEAENGAISNGNLKGVRFTGSNGNSIFIPASGIFDDFGSELGSKCNVWSSDLYNRRHWAAKTIIFNFEVGPCVDYCTRFFGCSVRGVK